jgi:integral membrane sensor domain MASE1
VGSRSDDDAILPVSLGTVVWAIILVVLLTQRARLVEAGTEWWIGAAGVGVLSGALGVVFLRWRRGRMDRRAPA